MNERHYTAAVNRSVAGSERQTTAFAESARQWTSVAAAVTANRSRMRRRKFIALLGAAVTWPLAARAQQPGEMRRIGVLMNLSENDPEAQRLVATFREGLARLGWTDGRNLRIDYRWSGGDVDRIRISAAELVALAPDVILAYGGSVVGPLQQVTRTVPIVFVEVIDPVGAGFVTSLARPGGNATGFSLFEFGISGEWLELLKQISPGITKAVVIRQPSSPGGGGQLGAIQAVAPSFGVEVTPVGLRDAGEIERALTVARDANGGLIVTVSPLATVHRDLIVSLSARYRVPAVYPLRYFVVSGGLISYGPDRIEPYRRAPGNVDRILKGEKPADLPVQAPTKYELVINLKTARTLGLDLPRHCSPAPTR
jgi:putative ABC transport system substrate-binding protein